MKKNDPPLPLPFLRLLHHRARYGCLHSHHNKAQDHAATPSTASRVLPRPRGPGGDLMAAPGLKMAPDAKTLMYFNLGRMRVLLAELGKAIDAVMETVY